MLNAERYRIIPDIRQPHPAAASEPVDGDLDPTPFPVGCRRERMQMVGLEILVEHRAVERRILLFFRHPAIGHTLRLRNIVGYGFFPSVCDIHIAPVDEMQLAVRHSGKLRRQIVKFEIHERKRLFHLLAVALGFNRRYICLGEILERVFAVIAAHALVIRPSSRSRLVKAHEILRNIGERRGHPGAVYATFAFLDIGGLDHRTELFKILRRAPRPDAVMVPGVILRRILKNYPAQKIDRLFHFRRALAVDPAPLSDEKVHILIGIEIQLRRYKNVQFEKRLAAEGGFRTDAVYAELSEEFYIGGDRVGSDPGAAVEIIIPNFYVRRQLPPFPQQSKTARVERMCQRKHIVALGIQIAIPDKHIGFNRYAALWRNVRRHVGERPDDDTGIFRRGLFRKTVYKLKLKPGIAAVLVPSPAVVFSRNLAALRTQTQIAAVVHLRKVVHRRRVLAEFGAVFFDERAQIRPDDIKHLRIGEAKLTAAVRLEMPLPVRSHREILRMVLGVFLRLAVGEKRMRGIIGPGKFREGEFSFKFRPPGAAP